MKVDAILQLAIRSLKAKMPEAIFQGSLVKQTRAFDTSKSTARVIDSDITPVEIIFDSFKAEELVGSNILSTDVKLHVIANNVKSIDFYTSIKIDEKYYTIKQKTEAVIGSKIALFTIAAQL